MNNYHMAFFIVFSLITLGSIAGALLAYGSSSKQKSVENPDAGLSINDFVEVQIDYMSSIPVGANPFHYDHSNMGTELVRGWTVMHEGYDHKDSPFPLHRLYLINSRTGQRIRLKFSKMDQPIPLKIKIGSENYQGSNRLAVYDDIEKAKVALKLRKVSPADIEKTFERVLKGHYVTVTNALDEIIEVSVQTNPH